MEGGKVFQGAHRSARSPQLDPIAENLRWGQTLNRKVCHMRLHQVRVSVFQYRWQRDMVYVVDGAEIAKPRAGRNA